MNVTTMLSQLRAERDRLDAAIQALEGLHSKPARGRKPGPRPKSNAPKARRRRMSAAARKRISAAMKARWAERKRKSA
jgi:hypothetical protein